MTKSEQKRWEVCLKELNELHYYFKYRLQHEMDAYTVNQCIKIVEKYIPQEGRGENERRV